MEQQENIIAPFIGINRHRLATDGVESLRSSRFLNVRCVAVIVSIPNVSRPMACGEISVGELLDEVSVDNIYFLLQAAESLLVAVNRFFAKRFHYCILRVDARPVEHHH